ncbi:hypothetical protein EPIR_1378 [Erwinia piriflorinigrans CFBP 5888]|uniref:Uncharacterized protein n=1 Tax=Erwinia piriflorinigrans CFBP 5888 TaxID=1161919 RepID=V5Z638_9GAMM|nr:hypothetical protein EPIR_1378 [Erwinia piriflorinigrans CFBP 5888]
MESGGKGSGRPGSGRWFYQHFQQHQAQRKRRAAK